jgi:hypothetical protein
VISYLGQQQFLADPTEVVVEQPVEKGIPEAVTEGQPRHQKVNELGNLKERRNNGKKVEMSLCLTN